jgi:hypothetical protein
MYGVVELLLHYSGEAHFVIRDMEEVYNKNQVPKIFRGRNCKRYNHTGGSIIPLIDNFLVLGHMRLFLYLPPVTVMYARY